MRTVPPGFSARLQRAHAYQQLGWRVFVLGRDKTTLPNCAACRPENTGPGHDRETCKCLTCHGFYAATRDPERIGVMLYQHDGMLAVRTGRASNLLVIDAEASFDTHAGVTGLDVLERWHEFVRDMDSDLPVTLRQRTGGGGLHLLYDLEDGPSIASGRILPMVDVKADGGYIAVPDGTGGGDGRHWLDPRTALVVAPASLTSWLSGSRRRGGTRAYGGQSGPGGSAGVGYSFSAVNRLARIPDGVREVYTRDLSFSLFKSGLTIEEVLSVMHRRWLTYDQPGVGGGANWYMPWEHVAAKVQRDRYTVQAEPLAPAYATWLAGLGHSSDGQHGDTVVSNDDKKTRDTGMSRVGRVTLVRRTRGE